MQQRARWQTGFVVDAGMCPAGTGYGYGEQALEGLHPGIGELPPELVRQPGNVAGALEGHSCQQHQIGPSACQWLTLQAAAGAPQSSRRPPCRQPLCSASSSGARLPPSQQHVFICLLFPCIGTLHGPSGLPGNAQRRLGRRAGTFLPGCLTARYLLMCQTSSL